MDEEVKIKMHKQMAIERKSSKMEGADREYIEAPIDKLGPAGRWIRHRLLSSSLYGTPLLCAIQRHRTPLWNTIMKYMSFFGTEEFYIVLICFVKWIVDARLGRLLCILMGFGFFVSNFLKNCLCLPRPPSPPVIPLEEASETWGLPSHHSVLCVVLPWYIWFYSMIHFNLGYPEQSLLFVIITTWSFSVLLCRVYLGVHSPADVVSGSIFGCLILTFWMKIDNYFDHYISLGNNVIMQALIYTIVLLFIHPRPKLRTGSFQETVCMLGTVVGFVIARSAWTARKPVLCKTVLRELTDSTSWINVILISSGRLLIGFILVLAVKALGKITFRYIVSNIYNIIGLNSIIRGSLKDRYFDTKYNKSFILPPIFNVDNNAEKSMKSKSVSEDVWEVEYAVKYLTYIFVGWTGSYLAPLSFHLMGLNISR
ncbi:probable sphingosine-1-phosphate phosphatase [Dendronephthya gigantea]|uniref:probable sphingosine-1-phosphate phosphatase n=1 Tax=Dendronephthya gigantea TaxID=151771 RepID=UPI00106A22A5|nr:probable sphingosine-1-phosphate phosphatase [Dendronephthya gigantea]